MIDIRIKGSTVCPRNGLSLLKGSEKASAKNLRNLDFILRTTENTRLFKGGVLWLALYSGKILWLLREKLEKSKTRIRHVPVRNGGGLDHREAVGRKTR